MDLHTKPRTPLFMLGLLVLVCSFGDVRCAQSEQETPEDNRATIRRLKAAYESSNHDPELLLTLTRALVKGGEVAEAARYVDATARHQDWNSRADMNLGLAFLGSHRCDVVQKRLRSAVIKDAAIRDEILSLGESAFDERDYDDALCLAKVSLEFDPGSPSLHSLVGACQFQLKDAPDSVAEIQKAIQIAPENEQYYLQLAEVFIDFNTPDAALILLDPAVKKFPRSARVRYFAGIACMKLSHYAEAERYLRESLQLEAQNPLALHAIADLYEAQQQWQALLEVSKSLAGIPSSRQAAYFYEAEAKFSLFRDQPETLPEIESLLRTSLICDPTFVPSFVLWGRILLARGAYTDSIAKLKRAVDLDPRSRAANYNLAMAYEKSGQSQKSSETWKKFQILSQREKIQSPGERLEYGVVEGGGKSNQ
jgi:tetratricopeptide (TPR) repeat protein